MSTYKRHRFPPDIISYAVWLYFRFNLSHRDIEDLLAERGITVSRESIRLWCIKLGRLYARRLKRKHRGYGDTFYIDEVFIKINGKQHYLWRAVDQDGEIVDVYLILNSMRITGPSNRMNLQGLESEGCVVRHSDGSNRLGRLRDFWVHMLRSPISSIWVGTRWVLSIIVISG